MVSRDELIAAGYLPGSSAWEAMLVEEWLRSPLPKPKKKPKAKAKPVAPRNPEGLRKPCNARG